MHRRSLQNKNWREMLQEGSYAKTALDVSLDQARDRRGRTLPSSPKSSSKNRSRSYSPSFHRSIAWTEQLVQSSPLYKHSPSTAKTFNQRAPSHPQESSSFSRPSSSSRGRGRGRGNGNEDEKVLTPREQVRLLEMRRERLRVQRQDRQSRRRSATLERLKKDYHAEVVPTDQKGGTKTASSSSSSGSSGGGGSGYSRNYVQSAAGTAAPSSSSSTRPVSQQSVRVHQTTKPGIWYPPQPLPSEIQAARQVTLPQITHAQQSTVRDWLLSLGLSILDGEGGFYYQDHAYLEGSCSSSSYGSSTDLSPPPPLPLSRDRLRNGQLWCELLSILEPDASMHVHLSHLMHSNVQTISQAKENLSRAFWLWRVRHCPPLPLHLLLLPEDVIQGKKQVIWGLLWEIMQCYGKPAQLQYHSETSQSPWPVLTTYYRNPRPTATTSSSSSMKSKRLDYTVEERRALDQSLLDWLEDLGILRDLLGALPRPLTILALEAFLKDGTLLCHLTERALQLALPSSFLRHPHSYSQCLANLTKCISVLRLHKVSTRYLYNGVEEEIARGQWDSLLGLLEDMHLYYDRIVVGSDWSTPSRGEVEEDSLGMPAGSSRPPPVRYPYLGPRRSLSQAHGASGITGVGGSREGGWQSAQRVSLDILSPPEGSQPPSLPQSSHSTVFDHRIVRGQASEEKTNLVPQPAFQPRLDLRASLDSLHPSAAVPTFAPSPPSQLTIYPRPSATPSLGSSPTRYSAEEMTAVDPALSLLDGMKTSEPTAKAAEEAATGASGSLLPRTSLDRLAVALSLDGPDSDGEALLTTSSTRPAPPPPAAASTNNDTGVAASLPPTAEGSSAGGGSDSLAATLQWVEEVCGQSLLPSFSGLNESDALAQLGRLFSDGVLLVRLVERLERVDLVAVTTQPKTSAQKRQNIRRALQCLADRQKRVPLRALAIEEEVAEGEGSALWTLLLLLRKVYPFH